MGDWFESLKKIIPTLPKGLINIENFNVYTGPQQKIEAKQVITSGEKTIIRSYTPETDRDGIKLIKQGNDFCLEENIPTVLAEKAILDKHKQILKKFKPFLNPTDFRILSFCYYVITLEDFNNENSDAAKISLIGKYIPRGKQIYNVTRAGLFEKELLPLIQNLNPGNLDDRGFFYKNLESLLCAPNYIFVNRGVSSQNEVLLDIMSVYSKMKSNQIGLNVIHVYSRGKRLTRLVELACKAPEIQKNFSDPKHAPMHFGFQEARRTILIPKEIAEIQKKYT